MPTYTYRCKKCGHEHTEFHAMSASPRVRCEVCKGVCEKQIGTGAGIIFKGSGFYETDYKKKSGVPESGGAAVKAAEKAGEKAAGKAPSADTAAKTESKGGKASGSGKD